MKSWRTPRPQQDNTGRHQSGRRAGVTLVEALVVISALSVVSTLCVTTICLLLRAEAGGARSLHGSLMLDRLANEFRRDVHAAERVVVPEDQPRPTLELTTPTGKRISYSAGSAGVERIEREGESVVHREDYRLIDGPIRFEISPEPRLVSLVYARQTPTFSGEAVEDSPAREIRIEAVPNRDQRFRAKTTSNNPDDAAESL